jgi:hypothetical protein
MGGKIEIDRIRKLSLTKHIEWKSPLGEYLLNSFTLKEKPPPRKSIKVEPTSQRYSVIGHAFDHMVNMKLSIDGKLDFFPKSEIAALLRLDNQGKCNVEASQFWDVLSGKATPTNCECYRCHHFNKFVEKWNHWEDNSEEISTDFLIEFSLSLGMLSMYKITGRYFSEEWYETPQITSEINEMEELLRLWEDSFTFPEGNITTNLKFQYPHFGFADSDLICGNHIIDWKVKTNPRKKLREDVAQMVGLCACARMNGIEADTFSLYFARHGYQFTIDLDDILNDGIDVVVNEISETLDLINGGIIERERNGEVIRFYY